MKIESRMDEFRKVSEKKSVENVQERMMDFEKSYEKTNGRANDRESTLPFGLKRYKTCPECGEVMEIHKIKSKEAIYRCKSCKKEEHQKLG